MIGRPKSWKHPQPISRAELKHTREKFWDRAPHYGGKKGGCVKSCIRRRGCTLAQTIIENAGVIVQNADLSICYD